MKTKTILLMISGASAVALGMSGIAGAKSDPAADVRATYDEALASFTACDVGSIGKYDADSHSGYYPDSAALVDENSEEGRQAAIDFCNNGGKNELSNEVADVVMLKDAALVLSSGHYKRTEPDGTVSVDTDYTMTDVLVKTKDGWKFRHTHVGSVMPAPEAASE